MGFYGNVSNTNKTAFSFDRVYDSRYAMDSACMNDGVFIGRYVLVEYDEPPISAYYNILDGLFYNTSYYGLDNVIQNPINGAVYLDIGQDHSANPFYIWDENAAPTSQYFPMGAYVKINPQYSPYTQRYNQDVIKYGRGYDSTAWRKIYDTELGKYRYVLISELNTVVPNFHLIPDAPSNVPAAPYFDRDTTTNIDYYLHDQGAWGQSIRNANKTRKYEIDSVDGEGVITYKPMKDKLDPLHVLSDETVTRMVQHWSDADAYGNQSVTNIQQENIAGDIYYNKAGFNKYYRSLTPQSNGESTFGNTINYEVDHSGRLYYDTVRADGSWVNGETKSDMMEWYIHLPVIGDTICQVWDAMYGYDTTVDPTDSHLGLTARAHRYTDLAQSRGDTGAGVNGNRFVTYDTQYVIGAINQMRDMLGYNIKDLAIEEAEGRLQKEDNSVTTIAQALEITNINQRNIALATAINNIAPTFDSNNLNYLYYVLNPATKEEQIVKEHYYAYAYNPQFETVQQDNEGHWYYLTDSNDPTTKRIFDDSELYYLDPVDNIYKRVNKTNYGYTRSDGVTIPPFSAFFAPIPRWKIMELPEVSEDSVYGLIVKLYTLLGTTNPNVRTFDTINGCINILRDMIKNIDSQMRPHSLLMTNDHGQITHMLDTENNPVEYPYFNSNDNQEILDCGGHWRLPVTYKLETFNLVANNKYFNKYWGNSEYHELVSTDTIGNAFNKVSEELSDIQYNIAERILDFSVDETELKTGDVAIFSYTINNSAPWKKVWYTVSGSVTENILSERNNNQVYLQGNNDIEGTFNITMANADITVTLHILDERNNESTQSIDLHYHLGYSYVISSSTTLNNLTFSANENLDKDTILYAELINNQYLYIKIPSANYYLYIDSQLGGFDLVDSTNHIYRTTNAALGKIKVLIEDREE